MPRLIEPDGGHDRSLSLTLNGQPLTAAPGETIAGMMLAHGHRIFRHTKSGAPRAPYCGMGTCFDCRVEVIRPGEPAQMLRACVTAAEEGMVLRIITEGAAG